MTFLKLRCTTGMMILQQSWGTSTTGVWKKQGDRLLDKLHLTLWLQIDVWCFWPTKSINNTLFNNTHEKPLLGLEVTGESWWRQWKLVKETLHLIVLVIEHHSSCCQSNQAEGSILQNSVKYTVSVWFPEKESISSRNEDGRITYCW